MQDIGWFDLFHNPVYPAMVGFIVGIGVLFWRTDWSMSQNIEKYRPYLWILDLVITLCIITALLGIKSSSELGHQNFMRQWNVWSWTEMVCRDGQNLGLPTEEAGTRSQYCLKNGYVWRYDHNNTTEEITKTLVLPRPEHASGV